jgi:hypothetical protein
MCYLGTTATRLLNSRYGDQQLSHTNGKAAKSYKGDDQQECVGKGYRSKRRDIPYSSRGGVAQRCTGTGKPYG